MIVNQSILYILILGLSISSSTASRIPRKDDFEFSSEDLKSESKNSITYNNDNFGNNNAQLQGSYSNLMKELGSTLPQKVYTKFYNETNNTRICWKSIIYVKVDLAKPEYNPWTEHEIVFDFPGEEFEETNSESDVVTYRVEDSSGNVEQLNFTVIERHGNVTISRHVDVSCGYGNMLKKTYYSSPKNDRERIVVKLSYSQNYYNGHEIKTDFDLDDSYRKNNSPSERMEKDRDLEATNIETILSSSVQNTSSSKSDTASTKTIKGNTTRSSERMDDISSEIVGLSMKNEFSRRTNNNSSSTATTKNINQNMSHNSEHMKETILETVDQNMANESSVVTQDSSSSDTTINGLSRKDIKLKHNSKNALKLSSINSGTINTEDNFLEELNENETTSRDTRQGTEQQQSNIDKTSFRTNSTPSIDSCSPILTRLLSGNGILPGLCNLKKNEKVFLKGDIVVSKRYFNKENNTEVEEPLYTIHENTEIEATEDEVYQDTTLQEIQ